MYTARHLGLVRSIKISNKFFEKVLGEWTICKAEKPVIKFGEKGKRQEKTGKVVKACSRKRKTFALYTKNFKSLIFLLQGYALLLINVAQW